MNKVKFAALLLMSLFICAACEDSFHVYNYYLSDANRNITENYSLAEPTVTDTTAVFMTSKANFSYNTSIYNSYYYYSGDRSYSIPYLCIKAGIESPSDPNVFFADAKTFKFVNASDAGVSKKADSNAGYSCYINVSNLQPNTTYYYALFCDDGIGRLYGEVKSFKTKETTDTTDTTDTTETYYADQLNAVDLGLSVKWADRLLSKTHTYDKENWKYGYQEYDFGAYESELRQEGVEEGSISGTRYDNARIYGDSNWRTPTKEQFEELIEKCSFKIYNDYPYRGMQVTGPNGKSVFIRAKYNDSHEIRLWTSSYYYNKNSDKFYGYYYEFILYDVKNIVEPIVYDTDSHFYHYSTSDGYAIWPVQN